MDKETIRMVKAYMESQMDESDGAHGKEHVYRVLHHAREIARTQPEADRDVLTLACLLHDIGRREQAENPQLCHAQVGAEKAAAFLREKGFPAGQIQRVCDCIRTHRYRKETPPATIEAKILFDADKLDVCGAMGMARTLLYNGRWGEPVYTRLENGHISDGRGDGAPSFFQEYTYKLEKMYDRFFTRRGRELAEERRQIAADFYTHLLREAREADGMPSD